MAPPSSDGTRVLRLWEPVRRLDPFMRLEPELLKHIHSYRFHLLLIIDELAKQGESMY